MLSEDDGGPRGAGSVMLSRSLSGRPGAEGAPFDGQGRETGARAETLEVWVG